MILKAASREREKGTSEASELIQTELRSDPHRGWNSTPPPPSSSQFIPLGCCLPQFLLWILLVLIRGLKVAELDYGAQQHLDVTFAAAPLEWWSRYLWGRSLLLRAASGAPPPPHPWAGAPQRPLCPPARRFPGVIPGLHKSVLCSSTRPHGSETCDDAEIRGRSSQMLRGCRL